MSREDFPTGRNTALCQPAHPAPTVVRGGLRAHPATTNVELNVSVPYYLEIFDNSSGKLVAICGMGTTCSIVWKRYWFDIGWDSFVAFVTRHSATIPDSPIASSTVADSIYPGNSQHPVP